MLFLRVSLGNTDFDEGYDDVVIPCLLGVLKSRRVTPQWDVDQLDETIDSRWSEDPISTSL